MSGLDIHYDLGAGHPLVGRRMPDLDLVTADGPQRVFTLLHAARAVLLNLGRPGSLDMAGWADRVRLVDAAYGGLWELPVLGVVTAPGAVLIPCWQAGLALARLSLVSRDRTCSAGTGGCGAFAQEGAVRVIIRD